MPGVTMNDSPVLSFEPRKTLPQIETLQRNMFDKHQINQRERSSTHLERIDRTLRLQNDRLRQRMRESTHHQAATVAGQALTPPIDLRDNFKSWIDDKALRDREFLSQQKIDPGSSPLLGPNSPDFETMLPNNKANEYAADTNVPQAVDESAALFRNPPESRTDSFRTAREQLSSDDESFSPDSPSLHPSRQKWLRDTGALPSRSVGLGLGLESDEDGLPTPTQLAQPQKGERTRGYFVTFDGSWNSWASQDSEDTESQVTARRDHTGNEKEQQVLSKNKKLAQIDSPTLGSEARTLSQKQPRSHRKREKQKQEKTAKHKMSSDDSEQTATMVEEEPQGSDTLNADIENVSEKRLSQASTTSTVVEAMVIEPSIPSRRPSLRHTGKIMRLDASRNQQSVLDQALTQTEYVSRKHQLRTSKNADQDLRESFGSKTTPAKASGPTLSKSHDTSVIVIPDRRSSLQSSIDSSKRLSKNVSLNSKPQSGRPTTAPEKTVGYFDIPYRERRTASVVVPKAKSVEMEKRIQQDVSPAAAAATKDLARTTSVTSRGVNTHYIPQTPGSQGMTILQTADANDNSVAKVDRSNSGDWTSLRPTSTLITPYSLRSAQSSTPGTLEVNEATAVCFFPHNNNSIVVIQDSAGKASTSTEHSTLIAGKSSVGPPSISQHRPMSPARGSMNSPLQNPREPPQPPGLKIIPPTPANAASSSDDTVHRARSSKKKNRFSTPFASLRRAMSARRYSESIANPFVFTRTLSLRDTTHHPRPRTADDDKGNQLHPLWRPRAIWNANSESDSDSEFGDHGVLAPRTPSTFGTTNKIESPGTVVTNFKQSRSLMRRLAGPFGEISHRPPVRRASVSHPSDVVPSASFKESADMENNISTPKRSQSLTRRIGGSLHLPSTLRYRPNRPQLSNTAVWHNQPNYEFVPASDRQFVAYESPYSSRNLGFQNFAERIERRRSLREEVRREERREFLKRRIKSAVVREPDLPDGFDIIYPPSSSLSANGLVSNSDID